MSIERSKQDNEKWMQLCEMAAVEQDPNKLLALVTEINRLLTEREEKLRGNSETDKQHVTSGNGSLA